MKQQTSFINLTTLFVLFLTISFSNCLKNRLRTSITNQAFQSDFKAGQNLHIMSYHGMCLGIEIGQYKNYVKFMECDNYNNPTWNFENGATGGYHIDNTNADDLEERTLFNINNKLARGNRVIPKAYNADKPEPHQEWEVVKHPSKANFFMIRLKAAPEWCMQSKGSKNQQVYMNKCNERSPKSAFLIAEGSTDGDRPKW